MLILIAGGTGFIGRRLAAALDQAGHDVICASRSGRVPPEVPQAYGMRVDYTRDLAPADWLPRLERVDAVVNAAGIRRERQRQTFDTLHVHGPRALFAACAQAGVSRVLQLSALGAGAEAASAFLRSKHAADESLLKLPLAGVVVQPALVYGPGGATATRLERLAALPAIPLPDQGLQLVQPVHLDDLVEVLVALLTKARWRTGRVPVVGPQPLAVRDLLRSLRAQMALPPAPVVPVPRRLLAWAARRGAALQVRLAPPVRPSNVRLRPADPDRAGTRPAGALPPSTAASMADDAASPEAMDPAWHDTQPLQTAPAGGGGAEGNGGADRLSPASTGWFDLPTPEDLATLERGQVADPGETEALLGRPPRPVDRFVPPQLAAQAGEHARLAWLLPLLRGALALLWGGVAAGAWLGRPLAATAAALGQVGVPPPLAEPVLHAGGALAAALALATLAVPAGGRRALWWLQVGVVGLTALMMLAGLPVADLLDPLAPVSEHGVVLGLLAALLALDGGPVRAVQEPHPRGPR